MRTMIAAAAMAAALTTPALAQQGHDAHRGTAPVQLAGRTDARVVTVKTLDYAFQMPDTIGAGAVTFRIENGGKEPHHVWLVKLEEGKTAGEYFKAMQAAMEGKGAPPSWAVDVGGPNAAMPGIHSEGTITLAPGNYLVLCHIPSRDGKPHSMKGMVKPLTVVPSAKESAEPKADVTMTLTDYDFTLSAPITAGRRTVRIVNAVAQPHEAFIARLLPGKTVADGLAWLEKGEGAPPVIPVGGATGLAQGRAMSFTADFEPGQYVLICFLPDAKDGKPHLAHGMVKTIEVR